VSLVIVLYMLLFLSGITISSACTLQDLSDNSLFYLLHGNYRPTETDD
jgi:hypothetical protein